MPQHDQDHVILTGGVLVWDGINNPETITQGDNTGKQKWALKAVFPPNCPDLQPFDQLATRCLQESEFRGQLPQGGRMPIGQVGQNEFNGMFPGWHCISFKSFRSPPDVWDDNGNMLEPMQYRSLLYGGQQVEVLASCYAYNKAGNRGVAGGLDAVKIILSANAQRQDFGGGGVDSSQAFGGGGNQNDGGYQNYDNNQNQGGGQNYDNNQNNSGGSGGNQNYNDNRNNSGGGGGGGGQPQQAHNFMPNRNN